MKNLYDLNKRLLVSLVLVVIVFLLITYSQNPIMKVVITFLFALICATALWEYANLSFAKEINVSKKTMIAFGVLQIFGVYFTAMPLVLLIAAGVGLFLVHFKRPTDALSNVATAFFGICYIAIPLSFMLDILYTDGRWWLVYLLLVTKITDIGAYFVGRLWGKHRLAPVLSPKKTVEGGIAGLVCAIGLSVAMGGPHAILLGAAMGIFGQIGDLAESLFKRDADFKDSNKLPGLGGILDMIDSLLFTAPILYCYLRIL